MSNAIYFFAKKWSESGDILNVQNLHGNELQSDATERSPNMIGSGESAFLGRIVREQLLPRLNTSKPPMWQNLKNDSGAF
uniref:Uncharacterized protein n=1 Tax=Ditylenchus dipsaci TaxID=166011 RepID=A0A915DUA0_9BILA